jgi:hypothetical protein
MRREAKLKKSLSFTRTRLAVAVVLGAIVAIVALTSTADSAAPAPAVTTGQGYELSSTSARVNGIVNPQGQSTSYMFQYGPTTSYGLQTSPASAGSGSGDVAVHQTLSGLTADGTYHYRLVAHSSAGTNYGSDQTVSLAPAASQVAFMGHMGFVSPGDVIGVEAGCFGGDTTCTGQVTMTVVGTNTVIGQTRFSIPAHSGGFQNLKISPYGASLLTHNGVWKLMQVEVNVTTTSGQSISEPMSLARWVWH